MAERPRAGVAALLVFLVVAGGAGATIRAAPDRAECLQGGRVAGACSAASRRPTWAGVTAFRRPAFKRLRRIVVSTAPAFWAAWNGIRPGDEIDVHGVVFTGEAAMNDKQLSGWAEVHFDARTRFVGSPSGALPAVWINADRHIRFYGGDLTNPGGAGAIVDDCSYVTWWGFTIHDTGGSGLMVQGIRTVNDHLDLKGAVSRWGLDTRFDPHAEKGTGLHGALLADAYYGVRDSRIALDLHDGGAGAGVSAGGSKGSDVFENNRLYLRCANLTMQARSQVGGNCLQFWGENVTGNRVAFLMATGIQGRPYDVNGMFPGQSLATNVVVYGRATKTNLNPYLASTEPAIPPGRRWDPRFGTIFRNVLPRA